MTDITIRILAQGDEEKLLPFLEERLDTSMFLYGNLMEVGFSFQGNRYEGVYAAAFAEREIVGVVGHFWNNNLILQSSMHLPAMIEAVKNASQLPIAGLIGPVDQVEVAKEYLDISPSQLQFDSKEKLLSLKLNEIIMPEELSSGRLLGRLANGNDLETLIRWRVAYMHETMGESLTPSLEKSSRESVNRMVEENKTWVIESSGKLVATSSLNARVKMAGGKGIVQVGGVWTPPTLRGKHYGRAAVAISLLDAHSDGFNKAILFTGEGNIAAQKAYAVLGFSQIGFYGLSFLSEAIRR